MITDFHVIATAQPKKVIQISHKIRYSLFLLSSQSFYSS